MVAGRRLWSEDEQHSAQHQAGGSGDLGIEAVVEDGLCAGEARGLGAHVEARRQVDEEDHGEAEESEGEDDPAQPAPAIVAQRRQREEGGEGGNGDQEEGMRFAGAFAADGGRACSGQTGIAGLADLYCAVIDELGGNQTDGRADDGQADCPLGCQHCAESGRDAPTPGAGAEQAPFQ